MPLGLAAATNDLSGLLQKGLFEEEANRNLEAAAQAYQTVSAQFDKDRKLAATAIFRLGEVYRKQNKTNEAAAQYERIVREFADQDTLVTLSRQNLSALGNRTEAKSNRPDNVQRQYLEQQSTVAEMEALLAQLKKLDREELRRVLPKVSPDPLLSSLLDEMSEGVKSYATVLKIRGEADPTTKEQGTKLRQLEQQVNERVDEVMAGLERRLTAARNQLDWLKSQTQLERSGGGSEPISKAARLEQKRLLEEEIKLTEQDLAEIRKQVANGVAPPSAPRDKEREILKLQRQLAALDVAGETTAGQNAPADDDEEKEIRRIQALIQNSPDLINGTAGVPSPLSVAAGGGQLRVATFLLDNGANVNAGSLGQTPLHNAVQSGQKAMVELLLQRGADVNARDGSGGTALHIAAQNGFLSVAEVLLKYKADLNARNSKMNGEQAPLHLAARNGHVALVNLLLTQGDDANRKDALSNTPLHLAAPLGRDGVVERLLQAGADVNAATGKSGETPLMAATKSGQLISVKALLAAKAKPDLVDNSGRTALSYAAENGDAECVNALLAAKADANAGRNDLPLHRAIHARSPAAVEALLRANADANRIAEISSREARRVSPQVGTRLSSYTGSPLYAALLEGEPELIKLLLQFKADPGGRNPNQAPFVTQVANNPTILKPLLDAGADPNATMPEDGGATALHLAADQGNRESVGLLLEHGAKPNFTARVGQHGVTPLMLAASRKDADTVTMLLKHKADPNLMDARGNTALQNAVSGQSPEVVRLLLSGGANPDTTTLDGYPVLMLAVTHAQNKDVAAALLEAKAKVNAPDPNGKTPLHWATSYNRKDLVELLINAGADVNLRDKSGKTPLDYAKQVQTPNAMGIPGVPVPQGIGSGALPNLLGPPGVQSPSQTTASKPPEIASLLREHGALDELPDFTRIRITRQGLAQPLGVFTKGPKLTNQFTLLETIMRFYNLPQVYWESRRGNAQPYAVLPFPDFGRVIIRRPSHTVGGKDQEIKVSLLNSHNAVDCAKDVPVEFGDVIEIPERVHALNEAQPDPVKEMEAEFSLAQRGWLIPSRPSRSPGSGTNALPPEAISLQAKANDIAQRWACLQKSVQLVIVGETTPIKVDSWKGGYLSQALTKTEARAVLRSSSDLSRVKVTRKDPKTGKPVVLIVEVSDNPQRNDDLWLRDGDVIEVPDKP